MRTFLGLGLALLLTAACNSEKTDLPQIKKRGKLIVAHDLGYLPFEMKNAKGEVIGFDVELARLLAKELGVKVEFINVDWDGIIPALMTGKVDCIISGMTIDAKRRKQVDFSTPYFKTGQSVLINSKDKGRFKSYKDLNRPGLVIATQTGTTGEKAARKFLPKATIKTFDKGVDAALEVKNGRAAGMVFDQPFIAIFAMRNPKDCAALLEPFTKEDLGIAVRKTSPKLLAALNEALAKLTQDGTLAKLEQKYFVEMPWLPDLGK